MTITFPSITQIQERIVSNLILSVNAGQLNSSKHIDPNIRNSLIGGLTSSMSAGFDENNDLIKDLLKQLFPQTATDEYLENWASFFGIIRKIAVQASGYVIFEGTAATSIPATTAIQSADGTEYQTQAAATISTSTIGLVSLTRSGTTATANTTSAHNLATGTTVTISGAAQLDYNITTTIIVISETSFTFQVANSPTTPATGTILATFTTAKVQVLAVEYGTNGNSSGGSELTLISPIVGVETSCYIDYNGFSQGLDLENDDSLRTRLLERTSNFSAPFTAGGLPVFIKEKISGITRVWVQTATPVAGKVTIYFARDGDANNIPTSAQALAVKNAIIDPDTGIKPANTPDSYVIVSAPTAVPINFSFSSLSPNTAAMRSAISTTLYDYFRSDSVAVGGDLVANEYNALIYSVIDADGNSPTFALTSPSGTISISDSELATLGNITFP
jgi:uncharacterized phage protein gp47/JayE